MKHLSTHKNTGERVLGMCALKIVKVLLYQIKLKKTCPNLYYSTDSKTYCRVTEFGPVCPQIIPDLSDEQEALRYFLFRFTFSGLFCFCQLNAAVICNCLVCLIFSSSTLRFMTIGRMNYLKKLFNFLKRNQNEDCLYLNIYAPEAFGRSYSTKMPVTDTTT